jgi:hypothetical protein
MTANIKQAQVELEDPVVVREAPIAQHHREEPVGILLLEDQVDREAPIALHPREEPVILLLEDQEDREAPTALHPREEPVQMPLFLEHLMVVSPVKMWWKF